MAGSRTAVVTGGAQGIGKAIARRLPGEGMSEPDTGAYAASKGASWR